MIGVKVSLLKLTMLKPGSRMVALTIAMSSTIRRSAPMKKEVRLFKGPPKFMSNSFHWKSGLFCENGFLELRASSLKLNHRLSVITVCTRLCKDLDPPEAQPVDSAENGFGLIRTSRIDSFGGSCAPENPSMKIWPPLGPAAGPARACKSEAS